MRTASFLVGILINLLPSSLIIVFLSSCGRVLVIFFQFLKTSAEKNELFFIITGCSRHARSARRNWCQRAQGELIERVMVEYN